MKLNLFALTLLTIVNLNAQNDIIFFKDGTSKKGYVKITQNDKIKFKTNKNSKDFIKYSSTEVEKIEINHKKYGKSTKVYKRVKNFFQDSDQLLNLMVEGKANLYYNLVDYGHGLQPVYYVDKEKELTTNPVIILKSDKIIAEFFKDCPNLLKLLKREAFRKFVKMKKGLKYQNRLIEIVKYYNTKCD